MSSLRCIPGLPFELTAEVNALIDKMSTLRPPEAPLVEPALLAPFLAVGDFANLSGPPGCGKTLLAADSIIGAVHPRREGRILGGLWRFDLSLLDRGLVAIIDGEGNSARWESTLHRKMLAEGLDPNEVTRAIKYMRPADLGLQTTSQWEEASVRLARALAAINVRFLVADTVGRIWAPDDINSTNWIQRGLAPFRAACKEYGISALLLGHTKRRKSNDDPDPTGPIGSSFQEGQVDAQIILSRIKGGQGLVLTHQKSRRSYWIQQGSKVTLHFKGVLGYEPQGGWQKVWPHECPDFDAEQLQTEPATVDKIVALLKASPAKEWSTAEIAEELDRRERTIRHHLHALEKSGYARKVSYGPQTRWGTGL